MPRMPNTHWSTSDDGKNVRSFAHAQLDVLMDIRDELQRLNSLLHCHNFTDMPRVLRQVRANTSHLKKPRTPKPS